MRIQQAILSCAVVLVVLTATPASAQRATISDVPLSDRRVEYTIDATLDVESRTVTGRQRLRWRNPDRVPVSELQFHLYLNAFKDENSTFMRESGGQHRGFSASGENRWGGITIDRLERVFTETTATVDAPAGTPTDLTDSLRFIQPDDDNLDDETVAAVTLQRPVMPGEWVELDFEFASTMPAIVARTGWETAEDGSTFFMVAQWFPKIGVLEVPGQRFVPDDAAKGEWNTHQFHANSEFYADFGVYDVTLNVPASYTVGATGVLREDSAPAVRGGDGTRTVRYVAEDVHDFAWTASSTFLDLSDTWKHVNLRLLLRPEHRGQAQRHFDAARIALEYFERWVGEYPYTTLTLVDGYGGANGMEYPTLITCGTFYGLPPWLRALELVTIHEFGHQYFYGLLASNEFEEAWLDEGMNSYLEARIMDAAYGEGAVVDFPGLRIDGTAQHRLAYTENRPGSGALFTRSWEYAPGDFGKASYSKPATVMNALEGYLGAETMTEFLRTYYNTWRFRHPTTDDLQDVAEQVSGEDLDWFFDQYVFGTAVVDYEVSLIEADSSGAASSSMASSSTASSGTVSSSVVTVSRLRDGTFPQTLEVTYADGSRERATWDGLGLEHRFVFDRPVQTARLDPDDILPLDINKINNQLSQEDANPLPAKVGIKTTSWIQVVSYILSGIL